jgi:transcriptional regulator with XRE-family HTH domain
MICKTFEKLKDPKYRKAFVASQINIGIPFQIRALLKSRPGWTQGTLAQRADMLQPRISGLMTPGKVRPNIETLRRIAEAFDCGLIVRFASFSELARWSEDFDPESFAVPSFAEDTGFIDRIPQGRAIFPQRAAQPSIEDVQRSSENPPIVISEHRTQALVQQPQAVQYGCAG